MNIKYFYVSENGFRWVVRIIRVFFSNWGGFLVVIIGEVGDFVVEEERFVEDGVFLG